ncbi:MAG: hypothetical protein CMLOHMNK_01481 [Steroidobacteraceae bacterium]|nr:hypothetical protein [Steroidobacteraceae bacterium]
MIHAGTLARIAALWMLAPLALAAGRDFDPEQLALTYHKLAGKPFDFERYAAGTNVVARASGFDRPDVLKQEIARERAVFDAASDSVEFATDIQNSISDYDHDRGEFSIAIFEPGSYMPVRFNGNEYRVVFANAEQARAIRMPKEEARAFDARIMRDGNRAVVTRVKFHVVGDCDPAGAVDGQYVVRAVLDSVQELDGDGSVLQTPDLAAAPAAPRAAFDPLAVDAGGLRVGVSADEMEAAITRLYRKPERSARGPREDSDPRFAGSIELDLMDCIYVPASHDREPAPGDVCLRAYYDKDGIVRQVRIEQVLPRFDYDQAREAAIARFGPVASVSGGSTPELSWGTRDAALGPGLELRIDPYGNSLTIGMSGVDAGVLDLTLTDTAWAAATPVPGK